MNYTKEKIIEDIKEYLKDNDMKESDIVSHDFGGDRYLSDYGPVLDTVLSQLTGHGVIVCDTGDEYYLQYQVSETIGNKYITIVTDNTFEQTIIESIEDLADVIIEKQEAFDNIIRLIKQSGVTE